LYSEDSKTLPNLAFSDLAFSDPGTLDDFQETNYLLGDYSADIGSYSAEKPKNTLFSAFENSEEGRNCLEPRQASNNINEINNDNLPIGQRFNINNGRIEPPYEGISENSSVIQPTQSKHSGDATHTPLTLVENKPNEPMDDFMQYLRLRDEFASCDYVTAEVNMSKIITLLSRLNSLRDNILSAKLPENTSIDGFDLFDLRCDKLYLKEDVENILELPNTHQIDLSTQDIERLSNIMDNLDDWSKVDLFTDFSHLDFTSLAKDVLTYISQL
jgi:hypothetical protein